MLGQDCVRKVICTADYLPHTSLTCHEPSITLRCLSRQLQLICMSIAQMAVASTALASNRCLSSVVSNSRALLVHCCRDLLQQGKSCKHAAAHTLSTELPGQCQRTASFCVNKCCCNRASPARICSALGAAADGCPAHLPRNSTAAAPAQPDASMQLHTDSPLVDLATFATKLPHT
jgi:hypothetical protein